MSAFPEIPNYNAANPGDNFLAKMYRPSDQHYPGFAKLFCVHTGESFQVLRNHLKHFSLYGSIMPSENEEVMLPTSMSAANFSLVMTFLEHYLQDTESNHDQIRSMIRCTPLDTKDFDTKVPKFYFDFMKQFELHDTNFHDLIRGVVDIGFDVMRLMICAYIACCLKLKTPMEICEMFKVPYPTDDEIAEVKAMIKEEERTKVDDLLQLEKAPAAGSSSSSSAAAAGTSSAADDQEEEDDQPSKKVTLTEAEDEDEDKLLAML